MAVIYARPPVARPKISRTIAATMNKQKYDLAKFFTFTLAGAKQNTMSSMNPITGIAKRSS